MEQARDKAEAYRGPQFNKEWCFTPTLTYPNLLTSGLQVVSAKVEQARDKAEAYRGPQFNMTWCFTPTPNLP